MKQSYWIKPTPIVADQNNPAVWYTCGCKKTVQGGDCECIIYLKITMPIFF